MIGKIQPPNPNILSAVSYNEKKMDGKEGIREYELTDELKEIEDGHVLATRNVPEDSTLTEEFDKLKLLNMKKRTRGAIKNFTFHMSVNPSDTDRELSEKEACEFIDELMTGLGYGEQPYRIYKHTDIERMHYHVVSSRAGRDGKKINDSFERLVLRAKLKELAPKYGYTVVLSEEEKEEERRKRPVEEQQRQPVPAAPAITRDGGNKKNESSREDEEEAAKAKEPKVMPFSRKSDRSVTQQITDAFEDAMKWNFSTFEQVQALLLRRYNVLIEVEGGDSPEERIVISGTDAAGRPITPIMRDKDLGLKMMERIKEKCDNAKMSSRKEQKKRIEGLARAAAKKARSFEEFRELMFKKGPYVVLSWSRTGEPFGVTWLDRATKCAWKGSETDVDFKWLKAVAQQKGWTFTKDKQQETIDKRAAMPSRKRRPTPPVNNAPEPPKPTADTSAGSIGTAQEPSLVKAVTKLGKVSGKGQHNQRGRDQADGRKSVWEKAVEAAEREEEARRRKEAGQGPEL